MQLTEEQIKSNLAAYEHAMRTASMRGIETKTDHDGMAWMDAEGTAFHRNWIYRIRPTPRLRPWKPEEVPVGAIVMDKKEHKYKRLITAVCPTSIEYAAGRSENFQFFLDSFDHSTDGGATWKACGVMEEGE